jgi:hypothetical protein
MRVAAMRQVSVGSAAGSVSWAALNSVAIGRRASAVNFHQNPFVLSSEAYRRITAKRKFSSLPLIRPRSAIV